MCSFFAHIEDCAAAAVEFLLVSGWAFEFDLIHLNVV
jgi:hypothetical protein